MRATGEEVVITKHGKPVARLMPVTYTSRPFFGDAVPLLEASLPMAIKACGAIVAALSQPPDLP